MSALVLTGILLARVAGAGPSGGLPPNPEAPSATDLLRASRMADEAARRLAPPKPKPRSRWRQGGGGWEAGGGSLGSSPRSR